MPHVHVTGTDRRSDVVVAVEDAGQWHMLLPFAGHKVARAAAVGGDRVVCLSDKGDLALIDVRSGRDIARRPVRLSGGVNILVAGRTPVVAVHGAKRYLSDLDYPQSLHIVGAADLGTIAEGDAIRLPADGSSARLAWRGAAGSAGGADGLIDLQIRGRLSEDAAGRLAFVGQTGAGHALFRIDCADGTVEITPIPDGAMPWQWLSASGAFALAPHIGRPFAIGDLDAAGPGRQAFFEAGHRHRGTLELWTTAPPRLVRLVGTRAGLPPDFAADVTWDPDETGFWVKFAGNSRQVDFQRIGRDGGQSPAFGFARFRDQAYPFPQEIADVADPQLVEVRVDGHAVHIRRDWCGLAEPFRLIGEAEDGFRSDVEPYPPEAAVKRFLAASARPHVVPVASFAKAAIDEALQGLANDIGERLADLLQEDMLEVVFKVAGKNVTERAFFARAAKARIDIAESLRALMAAYLQAQPAAVEAKGLFRQIWGPDGTGALGPAMAALLALDPDAHDLFRDYLARRDGEHETHSTDVIMRDYIAAAGWRDRAMIAFGIFFALIRHRDGREAIAGGLLDEYGLMQAAEAMIDPAGFAGLIVAEIGRFVVTPGLDRGSGRDLYLALQPSLETTSYGRQVLAVLAAEGRPVPMRTAEERGLNAGFLEAVAPQDVSPQRPAKPWWARLLGR